LAYHLSQKDDVSKLIYVEIPASVPELFKSIVGIAEPDIRDRWRRIILSNMYLSKGKIEIVTPFNFLSLYQYNMKWDRIFLKKLTLYAIKKLLKRFNSEDIILWISHPFAIEYIGEFGEIKVCYDCTERFSEFKEWKTNVRTLIKINDSRIIEKADIIFTQTKFHLENIKEINPQTYLIPNAVDYNIYIQSNNREDLLSDIESIKKPILGFIGRYNSKYIDNVLMSKVAESFPDCSLVLIGSFIDYEDYKHFRGYRNFYLLGLKPLNQIPAYLQFFDVCLLPLKIEANKRMGSPLKLYDYLASGKPIVATKVSGTEDFGDVVFLAENHEEFIIGIKTSLNENDLSMHTKRIEKARENTWAHRTEQVWNIIQSALTRN
jgi:glycosyltransferase involved in cell wall biosynthesis